MGSAFHFGFSADHVVCDGADGAALTAEELGRSVLALRALLPPNESGFVVCCRDRFWLLVSCLASWAERRSVVFAANDTQAALRAATELTGARTLLIDRRSESTEQQRREPTEQRREPTEQHSVPTEQHSAPTGFERTLNVEEVVALGHATSSEAAAFDVEAETVVATFFTSGTTGQPQRVDKTARQLFGEADTLARSFTVDEGHRFAATVPAHHLYGFLFSLLVPFRGGARFVRETPFQPTQVLDQLERFAVTDLVTVPAHLRALLPVASVNHTLRRVFSSGAVLDPALARDFVARTQTRVVDVLGSSETGGIASREPAVEETYRPLPGVGVDLDGEGHALLTSPFLPVAGEATPFGDRVVLVPGGFRFEGRADGVLKIAGKRVSVQELERVSRTLPGVRDAAIVVVETASMREREPWLLLASSDASWTLEKVRELLSNHFDRVVLPRRLRVLEELPRNALGKLERATALGLFGHAEQGQVTGSFPVPSDWVYFRGHFRKDPLLPGVVQLTQVVLPRAREAWPELGAVRGIRRLKFKRPIRPGETLTYRLRYERDSTQLWFELAVDGQLAATGTLLVRTIAALESIR